MHGSTPLRILHESVFMRVGISGPTQWRPPPDASLPSYARTFRASMGLNSLSGPARAAPGRHGAVHPRACGEHGGPVATEPRRGGGGSPTGPRVQNRTHANLTGALGLAS